MDIEVVPTPHSIQPRSDSDEVSTPDGALNQGQPEMVRLEPELAKTDRVQSAARGMNSGVRARLIGIPNGYRELVARSSWEQRELIKL